MKKYQVILIIIAILAIDQFIKFYIKLNFHHGEDHQVFGNWFRLHFVENEGMAWGWKLGESGSWGKLALTIFRLVAVIFGVFYINRIIREKQHRGFIICVGLIFAGAVGNLIDSLFYGLIFDTSCNQDTGAGCWEVAKAFTGKHYGTFLHGKVVDMLYFPIVHGHYPAWVPGLGGKEFEFFSPVFNVADASISVGLIVILLFQKRFFKKKDDGKHPTVETNTPVNDEVQVL